MQQALCDFLASHAAQIKPLLKELCLIPAPSHFEDARAAFCKKWLEDAAARTREAFGYLRNKGTDEIPEELARG